MFPDSAAGDTQWGRYEVFQQSRPGAPFANVGSVHAPDPEIAMQNARDVFVRRPQTHALWVAPATAILSRTAQEIETQEWPQAEVTPEVNERRFYLFRKTSQRRSMTYVTHAGELRASSAEEALRQALRRFAGDGPTYVWWVVPVDAIHASRPDDVDSMFEPAHDKEYRMPAQYRTQTMMRELGGHDDAD